MIEKSSYVINKYYTYDWKDYNKYTYNKFYIVIIKLLGLPAAFYAYLLILEHYAKMLTNYSELLYIIKI